jgi:hypothetical protein
MTSRVRLRLRPYYTGTTEEAEQTADRLNQAMEHGQGPTITVSWNFTAEGWDNTPSGGIGVAQSAAPFFYGVRTFGGAGIRTAVAAGLKRNPLNMAGADRWRSEVAVESPGKVSDPQRPTSAVLVASATLKDSDGRTSSTAFRIELYSHTPQVAAAERGHDPKPEFTAFVGQWVAMQRPDINIDPHDIASALEKDFAEQVVDAIHDDAAIRRAQILRTTYLTRERADYLSAEDLADLLVLAKSWADARWPTR